jgi:Uma2 family endonuclease
MAASAAASTKTKETSTDLPLYRLDLDTYNQIVASGALEGQRVELLDGVLVQMSPPSPAHSIVIERLTRHFASVQRWWTRVQLPLETPPDSEPQPDLMISAEQSSPNRHPRTAALAIEVAVSSQLVDRNVKAVKYALSAIPIYWLIDVPARTVEVHTEPSETGYRRCERFGTDAMLPCALEGVADVDLGALFEGIDR